MLIAPFPFIRILRRHVLAPVLALFLVSVLPPSLPAAILDKPAQATSPKDRERLAEALASRASFAAEVRPRLLKAGYGSPEELLQPAADYAQGFHDVSDFRDFWNDSHLEPSRWEKDTVRLADRLWLLSPFPDVVDILLSGLEQKDLPRELRLARFLGESRAMYEMLEKDELTQFMKRKVWGLFWSAGASFPPEIEARRKAAMFLAPRYLRLLEEEAPPEHIAAMHARAMPAMLPWDSETGNSPAVRLANVCDPMTAGSLLKTLAAHADDVDLWTRTGDFLDSGPGTPDQRLRSAASLVWNTDPSMAVASTILLEQEPDSCVADWATCWSWHTGTNTFAYGLHCSVEGNGAALLHRWIGEQRKITVASPTTPLPEGEKASIKRLAAAPDPTLLSVERPEARFWLLFAKKQSIPKEARNRKLIHVFANTPLSAGGPLLLPLDMNKAEDRALANWHVEEGAKAEESLLLLSPLPEKQIVRRMRAWHIRLMQEEAQPHLTLNTLYTGSYWLAHLPFMHGEAASLCLEPGETLYVRHASVRGDAWLAITPGPDVKPFLQGEEGVVLEFPADTQKILNSRFSQDFLDRMAREATLRWPRPGVTPEEALAFMHAGEKDLASLSDAESWYQSTWKDHLLLLWRLEGSPVREEGRRLLLDGDIDSHTRREKTQQLLRDVKQTDSATSASRTSSR